jgi:hypothetical protein
MIVSQPLFACFKSSFICSGENWSFSDDSTSIGFWGNGLFNGITADESKLWDKIESGV